MPLLDSPPLPTNSLSGALQGLTLLAVEDSRYAGEALRLMAQRSGARLRRADSLAAAERHLKLYRPDLVLIDIGLPDGSGLDLIASLAAGAAPRPPILAMSGDSSCREAALDAGAAFFLQKPWAGLAQFQADILQVIPGPRGALAPDIPLHLDHLALTEDLERAAQLLDESQAPDERSYLALFLGGIARHSHDGTLARAAQDYRRSAEGSSAYLSQLLRLRLAKQPQPFG